MAQAPVQGQQRRPRAVVLGELVAKKVYVGSGVVIESDE
jgi:hypothetical protein